MYPYSINMRILNAKKSCLPLSGSAANTSAITQVGENQGK